MGRIEGQRVYHNNKPLMIISFFQVHRDPRGGGSRRQDYPPPGVPPQLAAADPDKAELIRQVLQLSDVQIAALPPEQQASILDLKRQLGNVPK